MKKTGFVLAALAASMMSSAVYADDINIKIGVLNDRSGLYADLTGEGSVIAARMAVEDFGAAEKGINVEIVSADHQNRPDVASTSPPVVRRGRRRRDRRRADLLGGAGRQRTDRRAQQDLPRLRRRDVGPDRPGLHAQHGSLDLRHLGARQRHRPRDGGTGGDTWFFLTADYAFGHALERDTAAVVEEPAARSRHRPPSLPGPGLLVLPAPGAGLGRQGHRPRKCRRRHHQLDHAGGRVRHHPGRPGAGGPAGLHHRRQRARPGDRAGPGADRAFYWDLNDDTREWSQRMPTNSAPATCRP
jgi:branched-chain amino acid transport system substrate-binding protein